MKNIWLLLALSPFLSIPRFMLFTGNRSPTLFISRRAASYCLAQDHRIWGIYKRFCSQQQYCSSSVSNIAILDRKGPTKMSTDNGDQRKKRRVDNGVGFAPLSAGRDGGREDGLAEVLLSTMNKLLDQNRSMESKIDMMKVEMKEMKEEMNTLGDKCDTMEKSLSEFRSQNASHFDDVENRQKYHEVLLKNQKWEYAAPYPNEFSIGEHRVLDQMKKITCDMRYGKCNGKVKIGIVRQLDGGGVGVLAYVNAFLPHWKEFANALAEYQYSLKCLPKETESTLNLYFVQLPSSVLDLLSNALKSTHFKNFCLNGNNFGRAGITFALDYMQNNPQLEKFGLYSNPINNEDDVNQLCEIIKDHPALHKIELDECCGEGINGYEVLCSILTSGESKLKYIDLSNNNISSRGSTFLADFLATNPILETLVLEGNDLNDEDAKSIAHALKHNTNLRYLDIIEPDIFEGEITDSGWDALRKAEFDSTSLNSAADSNHTCYNWTISKFNANPYATTHHVFDPTEVRQKKIYRVLSARNRECSNVQHSDNVPVEFLPDMLASIHQYSNYHVGHKAPPRHDEDVKTLSVVYEILRYWEKAISVYESLSARHALQI